jgi:lysophospholipase L1-like esterase
MAALAETRDAGSHLPLPQSIRRLCCIGDSLTYGQGVAPRQTLATHIARFANMAYPDEIVWVDNRGLSSGNIWHSWVPFARLTDTIQYDAVIFSLCNNDSHIFESNTVRYSGDVVETWIEGGRLKPFLRQTLAHIARFSDERKFCLILDFYSRREDDAPIVRVLGEECATVGLPFVDLLTFLKEESGLSTAQFIASPFDGHPSDDGHRAAAHRLVEEISKNWHPQRAGGGKVGERLVDACDQAVRDGWAVDEITQWAMLVLDAKEVAARRRVPGVRGITSDLTEARAVIRQRYRDWYAGRAEAAQICVFHAGRREFETMLERADASLHNLNEMTYVLEHVHDAPIATELWALIDKAGYYNEPGRLQDLPKDLRGQLLSTAQAKRFSSGLHSPPQVLQFSQLRKEFARNLERLAALLPDKLRPDTFDRACLKLWQVAHNLVKANQFYIEQFGRAMTDAVVAIPEQPPFFTRIDVRVERCKEAAKRGGSFNMTVEIDYLEPRRSRRRYKHWAGADEDSYVYHFEMPLLMLGDVSVGVPAWDDLHKRFLEGELRITRIEISNNHGKLDASKAGFVWRPSADSGPVHWLTFNDLLVPA